MEVSREVPAMNEELGDFWGMHCLVDDTFCAATMRVVLVAIAMSVRVSFQYRCWYIIFNKYMSIIDDCMDSRP